MPPDCFLKYAEPRYDSRMNLFDLAPQDDDNAEFVDLVKSCLRWAASENRPPELYIIKIDNWFDARWCEFSGKAIGAFGTWMTKLTLPPFVPHRVIWERKFVAPDYIQSPIRKCIHVKVSGGDAQLRRVSEIAPNASFVWFSGQTKSNGRGALMAYLLHDGSHWPWYTAWTLRDGWRASLLRGVSTEELGSITRSRENSLQ